MAIDRSKGSSGIGLELAREYLRQGANVTIAARDMKKLQAAHEMLSKDIIVKDTGQKLIHISVDCGKSLSEGSLCNTRMYYTWIDGCMYILSAV
jgi:NAD(P)-dependent dehydrogenase (short-subunit alcohol dehydrogenase family)